MVMDKLKQGRDLLKMRGQAKELQKKLSQITDSVEKGKYHVKVTADQKIEYISIDGEEAKELRDAINEAFKNVQKKAAQKMMEDGGIGALLGGMGQ